MNKLVIDDYYPVLPAEATLDQKLVRLMARILEEKEICDRMWIQLRMLAVHYNILPPAPPAEKYSPVYTILKKEINEIITSSL